MKKQETNKEKKVSRRSFLSLFSLAGLSLSGLFTLVANLLYLKPTVDYGPAKIFRAGPPKDWREGTGAAFEKEKVMVIREQQGFAAISMVCTHLGCTVRASDAGFECPCHGSQFDEAGTNTGGPAPRPLDWFKVSLSPTGELEIDKSIKIPQGTFFNA